MELGGGMNENELLAFNTLEKIVDFCEEIQKEYHIATVEKVLQYCFSATGILAQDIGYRLMDEERSKQRKEARLKQEYNEPS